MGVRIRVMKCSNYEFIVGPPYSPIPSWFLHSIHLYKPKIRWVYASTQLIIQPVQPPMFGSRTGCGKCGRSSRKCPAHAVEIEGHDGAIARFEDPGSQDVFRFNCVYSL